MEMGTGFLGGIVAMIIFAIVAAIGRRR